MPYELRIAPSALEELKATKTYDRRRIVDVIDSQLRQQPSVAARNRKLLHGLEPDFTDVDPVWELRTGQYRVFYDVNEEAKVVEMLAIRFKPPHSSTETIV